MYPLVQLGPFRLSSGGLLLLLAVIVGNWLMVRAAQARGGAALATQAERCIYAVLIGAVIGARLWFGLFNWDLFGTTPGLFVALRVGDLAWPGALLGGTLAGGLWCRLRRLDALALADCAALALPPAQVVGYLGALLSGEVFGVQTDLPWGIMLFGATRHPTQLYFVLAALASWGGLHWLSRRSVLPGMLASAYLGAQGVTLLLLEALRADSLVLPGGLRAAQVFGLALLLVAVAVARRTASGLYEQPLPPSAPVLPPS